MTKPNSIQRYDWGDYELEPMENGPWVKFEDAEKLQKRVESLQQELDEIYRSRDMIDSMKYALSTSRPEDDSDITTTCGYCGEKIFGQKPTVCVDCKKFEPKDDAPQFDEKAAESYLSRFNYMSDGSGLVRSDMMCAMKWQFDQLKKGGRK